MESINHLSWIVDFCVAHSRMASDQSMAIGCQPTTDLQFYRTFSAFEDHEIDECLNEEEDKNTNPLEPFRFVYLFFVSYFGFY